MSREGDAASLLSISVPSLKVTKLAHPSLRQSHQAKDCTVILASTHIMINRGALENVTCGLGFLAWVNRAIFLVYWLTGQREDPDLCDFDGRFFNAAEKAQNLASFRGVLHHLGSETKPFTPVKASECQSEQA